MEVDSVRARKFRVGVQTFEGRCSDVHLGVVIALTIDATETTELLR
jgi:hypothetical protein